MSSRSCGVMRRSSGWLWQDMGGRTSQGNAPSTVPGGSFAAPRPTCFRVASVGTLKSLRQRRYGRYELSYGRYELSNELLFFRRLHLASPTTTHKKGTVDFGRTKVEFV